MKKKNIIILILILLFLTIACLVVLFHEDRLFQKCTHEDLNIDMICDKCAESLPFEYHMEEKVVEAMSANNIIANISGNMPKDVFANIAELEYEEASVIAKKYLDLRDENILGAYDISLKSTMMKYQPKDFNQSVKVELSNIKLAEGKRYAMLHIIDDKKYEIIPVEKMAGNKIAFNATSFSTYILITVEGVTITFDGENFKVFDFNYNEITNGVAIANGTDFRFIIQPVDGYGVTDITCVNAAGISVIETSGYIKMKSGRIAVANLIEDLTVSVTTVIAPTITVQPVSTKVKAGASVKFSLTATDATTYQWQYRDSKDAGWTNTSTSSTLSVTSSYLLAGREYRCLVGNTNFTNHERVASDIITLSVAEDDITTVAAVINDDYILEPIITVQPTTLKVKKGTIAKFTLTAENATTYQWQYRDSRDVYWTNLSSSSNPTLSVTATDAISGREYRCLVGNAGFVLHSRKKSDIVTLSVAEDDITREVTYVNLEITKQPESQKVKLGDKAIFSIETKIDNSYKWQYKPSLLSEEWLDVTSTLGTENTVASGYNTKVLTIDTSNMNFDEENLSMSNNLSGYVFRCVLGNSILSSAYRESDGAFLAITQDDILLENISLIPSDINISGATITLSTTTYDYDGTAKTPKVTVVYEGTTLIENTDYTITYLNNINAGTATIKVTGIGTYIGNVNKTFTISRIQITKPTLDTSKTYTYNGKEQIVSLLGFDSNTMLITNNTKTDAGNRTVIITLKDSNHEWSDGTTNNVLLSWKINPLPITINWENTELTYNGKYQKPTATISTGIANETIIVSVSGEAVDVGVYKATAKIERVSGGQGRIGNYVLKSN